LKSYLIKKNPIFTSLLREVYETLAASNYQCLVAQKKKKKNNDEKKQFKFRELSESMYNYAPTLGFSPRLRYQTHRGKVMACSHHRFILLCWIFLLIHMKLSHSHYWSLSFEINWFIKVVFGFMLLVKFQMNLLSKQWNIFTRKFMHLMGLLILIFLNTTLFLGFWVCMSVCIHLH
jgi:hypothetical protein